MTMQTHRADSWAGQLHPLNQADEPVYWFDGDFRTWEQVKQRVQLNRAIAAHISSYPRT